MYLNDNKITRRRGGSFAPKLLFYRTGEGVLVRVYCCIYIYIYIYIKKRIFTVNSDIFLSC